MKRLLAVLIVALAASAAMADDLTFEWNQAGCDASSVLHFTLYDSVTSGAYGVDGSPVLRSAACSTSDASDVCACSTTLANQIIPQRTYYIITSENTAGESSPSNEVWADPIPQAPPPPPGTFRITIQVTSGG